MQIFPLGHEFPLELVAGLFDMPFGDFYENQGPPWVNPFVTAPLLYGAEGLSHPLRWDCRLVAGFSGVGSGRTLTIPSGQTRDRVSNRKPVRSDPRADNRRTAEPAHRN